MEIRELRWPETGDRKAFLAAIFGAPDRLTLRARTAAFLALCAVRSDRDMAEVAHSIPWPARRLLARFRREDPGRHEALKAEGWSENLFLGACMSSLPEPALIYSRSDDLRAGDLVAFVADAMPQGMVKAFVGWRRSAASGVADFMAPAGGMDVVFYADKPEMLLIVPGAYLRAIEKIGYVKPKHGPLRLAPYCAKARMLGEEFGLDDSFPAFRLPSSDGGLRITLGEALREIQRRAGELCGIVH